MNSSAKEPTWPSGTTTTDNELEWTKTGCGQMKTKYNSLIEAKVSAAREMSFDRGLRLHTYYCFECHAYHLTRTPQ